MTDQADNNGPFINYIDQEGAKGEREAQLINLVDIGPFERQLSVWSIELALPGTRRGVLIDHADQIGVFINQIAQLAASGGDSRELINLVNSAAHVAGAGRSGAGATAGLAPQASRTRRRKSSSISRSSGSAG